MDGSNGAAYQAEHNAGIDWSGFNIEHASPRAAEEILNDALKLDKEATDDRILALWREADRRLEPEERVAFRGIVTIRTGRSENELHKLNIAKGGVTDEVPDNRRPCFHVFDDWTVKKDGSKRRPGVYYLGRVEPVKDTKTPEGDTVEQEPNRPETWICSPLHVCALTRDAQRNNHGRLLRFVNSDHEWRTWAMPMEMLSNHGDELRKELMAMGVLINQRGRQALGEYLQYVTPKKKMLCATQVGWCGDSFVLPEVVIGESGSDVIFQSGHHVQEEYTRAGTLAGWRSEIAARAIGNPILMLALSAAFAGPLLAKCKTENGGIHFLGDSSTGKTTALKAACSVWGGPNFLRNWRVTANGMEGAAVMFNDSLLALDEISQCDSREIGQIIYELGNGRGKQRANRYGDARSVRTWRCVILSSGERTIATAMDEGGHRTKAGQAVRLLDIPTARRYGAWDNLHGMQNGTVFSDAIKRAAATNYGHAGRAYLEKLTRDPRDFCEMLEEIKNSRNLPATGGDEQDKRAAGRFALLALAGEVATEYAITGWPKGAATEAARECYKAWLSLRGRGNDERRKILGAVTDFIERHGDSRFSNIATTFDAPMVHNRAGWWKCDSSGERIYSFTTEGLRDALKGFDFKRALDVLGEAGALPAPDASGARAKTQWAGGRSLRLYSIHPDKLGGDSSF